MRLIQTAWLWPALFFLVSGGAAAQSAASSRPAASGAPAAKSSSKNISKADLKAYNDAVDNFNKATRDFNTARGNKDSALLNTAKTEMAANITELQKVAHLPSYQNDPATQATLHNLTGYLYLAQDNPAAAIPELQATVQANPDNLDARNNLGNALRQTGRFDEAAVQYRYILDHFKSTNGLDTTRIKFNLATVLGQAGKTDESLALFSELAASNPDAATYKNYGFFLQRAGRSAEAADALRKAADLTPKDASAWLGAGELYAKGGRYDDAIAALTRAVGPDVDPKLDVAGQYDAYFALGEAHSAKGDTNQAIGDFQAAAGLQPQNAVPVYNEGVLQEQAGLKAEAEASYRRALQNDPNNVQVQTALGLLLASRGNPAEAIPLLAGAVSKLRQDATAAPVYARLGDQYARQKDYAHADGARRQALTLNPGDFETRVALADSYMARKQFVSALVQFDAAADLRPGDPAIQNQRGVAYKNLKQYPKALQAFKRAAALDPRNAEVQNNIGVLYEMLGNKAQAIVAYKKALALSPSLAVARKNLNRFARE